LLPRLQCMWGERRGDGTIRLFPGILQRNVLRAFGLAASPPKGLRDRRERGRRNAAILLQQEGQPFGRPRRLLPCRGCGHIVSGLIGPALARFGRASRVQDLELLRASFEERRCATGVRAGCCQACTAPVRGPGIRGELDLASDATNGAAPASTG
jgi:hypothetical protein